MWRKGGVAVAVAFAAGAVALVAAWPSGFGDRSAGAAVADDQALPPRYLTIVFGRSMIAQSDRLCRVLSGAVPLARIAEELTARGVRATGNVTLEDVGAPGLPHCADGVRYADWDYLARLRDVHGWSFHSRGAPEGASASTPRGARAAMACRGLAVLYEHGHDEAWAMYSPPSDTPEAHLRAGPAGGCHAFARAYGAVSNPVPVAAPYVVVTRSVNGGRCNDPSLPCSRMAIRGGRRYESPDALAALANARDQVGERWTMLQWYRIVDGAYGMPGRRPAWDCTSADWRRHWTTLPETYCLADFRRVLDGLDEGVVVTDPAELARRQGRDLGLPAPVDAAPARERD
jgi:hypothetical protein